MRVTGTYEQIVMNGEEVQAYIPHPLPPKNPPLMRIDKEIARWLGEAEEALGRLRQIGELYPSFEGLVHGFMRKEAVASATFPRRKAILDDLVLFEAHRDAAPEVSGLEEASHVLEALNFVRSELARADGPPLSMRLLTRVHQRVMHGAQGAEKTPAGMRRAQAWIGGTRPGNAIFIPPTRRALPDLLGEFEKYLQSENDLPPLMRAGLLHAQLLMIHPYMHGNGRMARVLINMLLVKWKLLDLPHLPVSLFFKRHRDEYYRRLGLVRTEGDWEGWMRFFLEAVAIIAREACVEAKELIAMIDRDRSRTLSVATSTVMSMRLLDLLPTHPLVTTSEVMQLLATTRPTAMKAIGTLVEAGVLSEITGKKRDRIFAYGGYLDVLKKGTD